MGRETDRQQDQYRLYGNDEHQLGQIRAPTGRPPHLDPGGATGVSTSDALFDETRFPWRPKGDQRPEDPPPLPGDGDAAQPPTLPPADEAHTNHSRIESNLAVEFARASQKGPHLAPRIGAARLSRRVLILFSGPYARPDGLVAFLQRLGLEVVPVDNDSSGGDKAHDLLRNDFYSDLPRRAQRGEFLVIWAAPPCSTFSICRLGDGVAPTKRSWKRHCLADVFAHDAAYCALYVGG